MPTARRKVSERSELRAPYKVRARSILLLDKSAVAGRVLSRSKGRAFRKEIGGQNRRGLLTSVRSLFSLLFLFVRQHDAVSLLHSVLSPPVVSLFEKYNTADIHTVHDDTLFIWRVRGESLEKKLRGYNYSLSSILRSTTRVRVFSASPLKTRRLYLHMFRAAGFSSEMRKEHFLRACAMLPLRDSRLPCRISFFYVIRPCFSSTPPDYSFTVERA